MSKRLISLILAALLAFVLFPNVEIQVKANPIPYPVVWMPREDIYVNLSASNGTVCAKVHGVYHFSHSDFKNVSMTYPISPNSTNISVEVNGSEINWWYSDKTYSSVLGNLPMINWTIYNFPAPTIVEVDYEHIVPKSNNTYQYLYAMGTGRYFYTYSKTTTAYIHISIDFPDLLEPNLYMVDYPEGRWKGYSDPKWVWNLVEYDISKINSTWTIKTTRQASYGPLLEDVVLTFEKGDVSVPKDHSTIQEAINAVDPGDVVFVESGTYYEHITINKSITLMGEDKASTIIDGNLEGTVVNITGDNVTFTGFTIQRSFWTWDFEKAIDEYGIAVSNCDGVKIIGNRIVENNGGIYLKGCNANDITKNNITNSHYHGIFMWDCKNNIIVKNEVRNCSGTALDGYWGVAIYLYQSNDNLISRNHMENNPHGLRFSSSGNNTINANYIKGSSDGVYLQWSHNNTVNENSIISNFHGIHVDNSNFSSIYHNNFINNTMQVHIFGENPVNIWDNGKEGNYWSDYNGTDSNGDGIGDIPYMINKDNRDRYPLMSRWEIEILVSVDYEKIQEAINAANPGDVVFVESGTYYEHITINKSITLMGEDKASTAICGKRTGTMVSITGNDVHISDFTVRNSEIGVLLSHTTNSTIRDLTVSGCYTGVHIYKSANNTVTNCNLGIYVENSNNSIIFNNTISSLTCYGVGNIVSNNKISGRTEVSGYNITVTKNSLGNGIELGGSRHTVSDNNISYCRPLWMSAVDLHSAYTVISDNSITDNGIGIFIQNNHNLIFDNTIMYNEYSIRIGNSRNNTFYRNNIVNNKYGFYLRGDINNNLYYHNNIVNNTFQVKFYVGAGSADNRWDNGYPLGGNYWSNYGGKDLYSGSYQNETGSDYIGDRSHPISVHIEEDKYPLMMPYDSTTHEMIQKYIQLRVDYNNLDTTYDDLIDNLSNLNMTYYDLQSDYKNLQSKQEAIIKDLSNIRNMMYVFIIISMVSAIAIAYLIMKTKQKTPKPTQLPSSPSQQ